MKRLMCLSLLLCLGMGVFAARGFATETLTILDLGGSAATDLGAANEVGNKYGGFEALASAKWDVNTDAPAASLTFTSVSGNKTLAIGSSATSAGTLSSPISFGNIIVNNASADGNGFVSLLIGGLNSSFTAASATDGLNDFTKVVGGATTLPGKRFSASFDRIFSAVDGVSTSLQVLVGNKAEFIRIADLTAKTAAVQGDLATGNALELTKLTLKASSNTAGMSSTAIDGNSTLIIGSLDRSGTASGDAVTFGIASAGADKVGKIVFTNDITLGGQSGNKDTVTFTSGTAAGDAAAVLEARGNLTLKQLGSSSLTNGGDLYIHTAATDQKGLIAVAGNLTINTLDGGSLAGVDVAADGSAVINNAAGTAATLTLGDDFTANGVAINGSGTAANTLTVTVDQSLKSGLATAAQGTPGAEGYVAPGFTPNTITLNGNNSGVVLEGAGAATSKVDASVIRVLGGAAAAANNNKITGLDVRSDLVVGDLDTIGNLTVTSSRLRNLTQGQGETTIATGTEIAGMTMVFGKKEFQKAL